MNIQPKIEPGLPFGFTFTNPNNFEEKTIQDLVAILRGTYQVETFNRVEDVLVSRDARLREEIQRLQENVDLERRKIEEELHFERLTRIQGEVDFKEREELHEKEKRGLRESYESLMREVKVNGLAEGVRIRELREKNSKLECEVKKLKEKSVDDGNEIEMLRVKNDGLELEVMGLREMKGKWEEDSNELGVLRKSKKKWLDDSVALDEAKRKVRVLEDDKHALDKLEIKKEELEGSVKKSLETISKLRREKGELTDEKRRVEKLLESSSAKFCGLNERVERLENDISLLLSVDGSGDRKKEGERTVKKPVVADFEEKDEDVRGNEFGNDTVEEAEDVRHSLGVAASTQPQNKGDMDAQSASPGKGTKNLEKKIEIINLDDDDDDQCMSRGVHEKQAISGIAMKFEDPTPSSSVAWQHANPLDMLKRKISFSDCESSSSSSDDSSFLENPAIRSAVSHAKKRKM